MKKIMAIVIVAALMCGMALTASAAESTLEDLTCEGHWTNWSEGVEITTEGITITMDAKTINGANLNWNAPQYIVFSSDNGLMFGDNYTQYYHERADLFGWDNTEAAVVVNALQNDWSLYVAQLAAGTKVTINAIRVGDSVTVDFACAGAYSRVTVPVTAGIPAYLALSGEQCAMTNIKVANGIITDTTLETSVDCTGGFRFNHTKGIEITDKEVTITATSTSIADNNWNGLVWILFKGNMPVPASDADIYWIERPDNYGWSPAGSLAEVEINAANADGMASVGVTHNGVFDDTWSDWAGFVAAQKAGAEVTITAKRDGNVVTVVMSAAGLTNTVEVPVNASEPAYLALTGDMTTLTNIKVSTPSDTPTTPSDNPTTGDMAGVVIAMMAVSGAALVMLKKKEF